MSFATYVVIKEAGVQCTETGRTVNVGQVLMQVFTFRQTKGPKQTSEVFCVLGNQVVVEELETLPADTKPRASYPQSPKGERRRKKKRSTIFLDRSHRATSVRSNI